MRGAILYLFLALSTAFCAPIELSRQSITFPGASFPLFVDLECSGRSDVLALDQASKSLLIYRQSKTGYTNSPDQTIPLPPRTAWVAPCDVDAHPGLELLFASAAGYSYSRQVAGRFETELHPLVTGSQVFTNADNPILLLISTNPASQKFTNLSLPLISDREAVVYHWKDSGAWVADAPLPLKPQPASWQASLEENDWAIASINPATHQSVHPALDLNAFQSFLAKSANSQTNEPLSENVRKLMAALGTNGLSGRPMMRHMDIDGDGRKDLVVWQVTGWLDMRTDLYIFLRGADGKLPDRPTQTLHCRGFPIPIGSVFNQTPLGDINGDGVCELILLEPKATMFSPNSVLEAALSHEIEWSLAIRSLTRGRISNEPQAYIPLRMLLSLEDLEDWPICIHGDFNRDGHPDLVVRRKETLWNIFFSTKDARWFESQPALTFTAPIHGSLDIKDLNGDGRADIIWREQNEHRISVYLTR
jgi:hypothetical protein